MMVDQLLVWSTYRSLRFSALVLAINVYGTEFHQIGIHWGKERRFKLLVSHSLIFPHEEKRETPRFPAHTHSDTERK